jgi:hypothetical protein
MAAHDSDNSASGRNVPALIQGPPQGPVIDLEPVASSTAANAAKPAEEAAAAESAPPRQNWLPPQAPLAAGLALAIVAAALAGAGATAALMRDTTPPATLATADATRALQDSVKQLGSELAMLKSGVATAQRAASTQLDKIAGRLERAEKAQSQALAEPTNKLARIQESIERLEHRQVAAAPSPEITGSVKPKEESKPPVAEGWRLRDFYDGRAIVEGRNGTLYRVSPGSNVPGLGKVETIKRENGKVVVVTASGIIAATLEPRRPSYYPRW